MHSKPNVMPNARSHVVWNATPCAVLRALSCGCDAEFGTVATQGSGRVRRKSVVRGGWKKRERDRYASKGEVDEKQLLSKKRCKPKRGYRCSGCQKNGHSLAHCPHKANPTPHLCSRCKQPGHNARTCVVRKAKNPPQQRRWRRRGRRKHSSKSSSRNHWRATTKRRHE